MSAKNKRMKKRQNKRIMKLALIRVNDILDIILRKKYESIEEMHVAVMAIMDKNNRFIQTL